MADEVYKVMRIASITRLIVLVLQFASTNFITADYDSSNSIGVKNGTLDKIVYFVLRGFTNWDSVYFLEIGERGYQYEQFMAFFPLQPLVTRLFGILPVFENHISYRSVLLISGCCLSCICFTIAAGFLYKLTQLKFKDHRIALFSSILFCINPASVFMSSAYTESMFVCFLFSGLYFLEKSEKTHCTIIASILLAFGSASRSNGILSCGFVSYFLLRNLASTLYSQVYPTSIMYKYASWRERFSSAAGTLFKLVISNAIILSPFFLFQYYGYFLYCNNLSPTPPWCNKTIPLSYSYIQDHYWNVGFLRYYQIMQIPNFLLALPMIFLSVASILEYFQSEKTMSIVMTLGFLQEKISKDDKRCNVEITFHSPEVFVYIVHLSFLTAYAVTSIHVQVLTRLIASSSPIIYWYTAYLITKQSSHIRLILGYFLSFFTVGIILHCNFYPWT